MKKTSELLPGMFLRGFAAAVFAVLMAYMLHIGNAHPAPLEETFIPASMIGTKVDLHFTKIHQRRLTVIFKNSALPKPLDHVFAPSPGRSDNGFAKVSKISHTCTGTPFECMSDTELLALLKYLGTHGRSLIPRDDEPPWQTETILSI